ncbi:MAG: SDR family oxidoreductase [Devosia nanyangense]|uniref:SDR family oxidoreductase n=1 Tax=Devosia nanyangense TaxID=1228055 RepID=A0A933L2L1_9HYPH|nr:SDR family oxidoreductase [Devosia nanyangense]
MAKVLFVGGTGQISRPCVERALEAGHQVSVFNRGQRGETLPAGVTSIVGDMTDRASYRQLGETGWDVVAQFMVFTPEQMATDIATFSGKVGQYIFISSASVYQKSIDSYFITEATPAVNPYWGYSQAKIACETLMKAAKDLRWTNVRPSHTVRSGIPSMLNDGDNVAWRMLAGKPIIVVGDGNAPWTLTRSEDFAKPFVGLFGKPAALGEDFHITGDKGFTWDAIYSAIGRGIGATPKLVHVPTDTVIAYNPEWEGPLRGDKSWTLLFDNSKVKRVAGDFVCATDLDVILSEPIRFLKTRLAGTPPAPPASDALMDRIAAAQLALGH